MHQEAGTGDEQVLLHEAIRPARKGFLREQVYASRWCDLMAEKPEKLEWVLRDLLAPIGQREATVAASVVTWLGTNMGQALLEAAKRRQAANASSGWTLGYARSDAHLSAWVAENRRKLGIDNGVRALEAILAPQSPDMPARPSVGDYEVAEHVMFWLGQHDGQEFVEKCQAEVDVLTRIDSLASHCRFGTENLPGPLEMRCNLEQWAGAGKVAAAAVEALLAQYGPSLSLPTVKG